MPIRVKTNQLAVLRAMARRNMSQKMLSIKTGISKAYVSEIISGVRYPSPEIRQKLQDALAPLTFDDLFIIEEDGSHGCECQSKQA
jgi:transcriptional regulator with XRE-family HTH domain